MPDHIREAWSGSSRIVEVTVSGIPDGTPFRATHVFLTSLQTSPDALLRLVPDHWSMGGWHRIHDIQLHEDAHGDGACAITTLRPAAMNLLRLAGFRSIRARMQTVMHHITTLLAIVKRQPQPLTA